MVIDELGNAFSRVAIAGYDGSAGVALFVDQSAVNILYLIHLKGHSHLVHMRIRYYFLADLHITLHHKSRAEKRIL